MSDRLSAALLVAAALAAAWFLFAGRRHDAGGTARFHRWMRRAGVAFLAPTLIALLLLGRFEALWTLPPEFAPLRASLPAMAPDDLIWGAIGGVLLGLMIAAWRARRGAAPIGRSGALTPRHHGELGWGTAVALVAGVTEEPFFRLLLPLLVTLVTGSAVAGFALATLLFGLMHRYQGWRGMVATTLFGGVMAAMYLMSGALWLVVLLHALIDLNGLVVWPALRRPR